MKVTYLGTTVLLFDDGKDQVMFDAYFSRPSLAKAFLGKLKTDCEIVDRVVEQYKINRLKGIFVSHTHIDHVLDAPYLSKKAGAIVYGSTSAGNVARGGGVPEDHIVSYEDCRHFSIGDFDIEVIPSVHSKAHWYNDDLGKVIDEPLVQPKSKKYYKEGGSYDFIIRHTGKTYVIRPSFNYIEGQLDGIKADVLYLGVGGMSKHDADFRKRFFAETVEKTHASHVIPIHWDNFFKPIFEAGSYWCKIPDNSEKTLFLLAEYCGQNNVDLCVQLPMTTVTWNFEG